MDANQMARLVFGMDRWPERGPQRKQADMLTTHEALGKALDALNPSPGPVEDYAHRVDLAKRLLDQSVQDMRAGHWTSAESFRADAYTTVCSLGAIWLKAYEAENGPAEMCEHGNPEWTCRHCAEAEAF